MPDTAGAKKGEIVAQKDTKMSKRVVASKENVAPSTVSRINGRYGMVNPQFRV
jgi:IS30 family transposase